MNHYVYILECADSTFYTGYATDLKKRLSEHNGEGNTITSKSAGAKYTRGRRPVGLVYQEVFKTRSEALKREYEVKQLKKSEKILLIGSK